MKKIKFLPMTKMSDLLNDVPSPSTTKVPDWYKKTKKFTTGTNDLIESIHLASPGSGSEMTLKGCVPFIDALTAGYMINLPATVLITKNKYENNSPFIQWGTDFPIVDSQNSQMLGDYPIPEGYHPILFRWLINWKIETPLGYSLWVTHPSHRNELPFMTLNGFIDTDKHPNQLSLPFFLKKGFEGMIEKDTPIAQIIPIKRDSWESERGDYLENIEGTNKIKQYYLRGYKKMYWSRKIYR